MTARGDNLDLICVGVGAVGTALQTQEILSWISLGLTIASTIVCIVYRVWKWYEEAKKDGKITADEVKDLADDLSEEAEKTSAKVNKEGSTSDKGKK